MTTTTTARRDPVNDLVTGLFALVGWVIIGVFTAVWWAVLFPMFSLPIAGVAGLFWFYGWLPALGAGLASIGALGLWWLRFPASFTRWTVRRARSRFLAWHRYRRPWATRLDDCHLTSNQGQAVKIPRLIGVEIGESIDRVRVRMLSGQCPEDWTNRTAHLGHAFGAQECKATITGPGHVELVFRHRDSLAQPVPLRPRHMVGGLGGPPRDQGQQAA